MGWYQVISTDPTETLADTKFDFENTEITEDITLKAKWAELSSKMSWNFDDDEPLAGWTFVDKDGDNHNWELRRDDGSSQTSKTHSSPGVLASASFDNSSFELKPDNWAITPLIRIPEDSELSFWMVAQHVFYPGDVVAVYIGDDLNDLNGWTKIGGDYKAATDYIQVKIDLSGYAGQAKYIAFRHYKSYDIFSVNLDDVSVEGTNTEATVTFDSDGGSEVEAQTVTTGTKATRPADPTKEGFTFNGWTLEGEAYDFDTSVTGDITLKAVWEEDVAQDVAQLKVITTSFKDRLQLNYYFVLPAKVLEDENAYLLVTKGDASSKLPVKDAQRIENSDNADRNGCHMFSYSIVAKEARDNVNVALFYGDDTRVQTINSDGTKNLTESGYDFTAMTYLDSLCILYRLVYCT